MKLIAITPEYDSALQNEFICRLIDRGFEYVHIRKPSYNKYDMQRLLDSLPKSIHHRLKLHSHFELAKYYDVGGIHLNHRNNIIPDGSGRELKLSKSCHSIAELTDCKKYEYVFLSPIYNSISKIGYCSNFSTESLAHLLHDKADSYKNVFALGGVSPSHMKEIEQCGFAGAAFLGYIFNNTSIKELDEAITDIHQALHNR